MNASRPASLPWFPIMVVMAVGLGSFILVRELVSQAYRADERISNIKYSDELAKRVWLAQANTRGYLLTGDSTYVDSVAVLHASANRWIDRLRSFQGEQVQTQQIAIMHSRVDSLFALMDTLRAHKRASPVLTRADTALVYQSRTIAVGIRDDLRQFQRNENILGTPSAEWFVKLARLSKMAVLMGVLIIIAAIVVNDRARQPIQPTRS